MTAPDPMKGIRGVFAAVLVLEAIVVLLALLVFARFGSGPAPLGIAVIVTLAVLMIAGARLQRRPWGLGYALALQAVTIVAGFLLGWGGLLLMRRDVAQKMARGELPAQQVRDS